MYCEVLWDVTTSILVLALTVGFLRFLAGEMKTVSFILLNTLCYRGADSSVGTLVTLLLKIHLSLSDCWESAVPRSAELELVWNLFEILFGFETFPFPSLYQQQNL